MTRHLVNSLGLLALLSVTTPAAAQRSARRVVRTPEIAAGGWHRLGDVVAALMPGNMASVDGFNAALTGNRLPFAGLSAAGSPGWMVRLDGQRIPVSIDGMWILDALPVAMPQVDSIVVTSGAGIVDGLSALLGTIDIYTRQPAQGLSGVADYQHGDESGDPGPYRYTPRATPNVEKLGPFTSGAFAYSGNGWSLDGAARYSSLNITDTSISRRFPGTFSQIQSDVNSSGGSAVLTTSFMNGTQYTIGGRGRFTGLLWVPSLRREEQLRLITTHVGSSGNVRIGGTNVRYGLTGTLLDPQPLGQQSPLPLTIGFERAITDAFAEVALGGLPAAVGMGVNRWEFLMVDQLLLPGGTQPEKGRSSERAWVNFYPASTEHRAMISAQAADGKIAPSLKVWGTKELTDRYEITGSLASIQRVANADGAWIDQQTRKSTVPVRNARIDEVRVELADNSWSTFTPSADLAFIHSPNWQLNGQFGSQAQSFQTLTLGAGVETKPTMHVTASVRAEASAVHAGSASMDSAMRSTPAMSLRADVSTVVMTNFRLSASGRLTTSTLWPVESIVGETPQLPELRRLDLSANKPFWHERIRAQVVVRNALATNERYHPVGASWNWRTHLALTVALPPYSSASTKP